MTTTTPALVRLGIVSFAHHHNYGFAAGAQTLPGVEIVAVWDADPAIGAEAAAQFGTTFEADLDTLLARDDIDAVIIGSENVNHARHTIAAAKAGKHVLCEKPLATTVEDAQAMVDACAANGVKLQTAFPVRFVPSTIALRDAIRSGTIGTPLAVTARNPGTCPHRWFVDPALSGGGAVMDHTVHVVDVLRWIFDAEFTEVYAEIDTRIHDIPVDDTGLLMLKMSNGIPVSLDTSWSRPESWPTWGGVTIEVIGEEGVLSLDAFADVLEVAEIRHHTYTWRPVDSVGDAEMVRGFVDAIRNDTPTEPSGVDGLRAVQVTLAAYESARAGEPVAIAV
jgi:UDP-N-acetylglucosamine 3-dehydrogenase